MISQIKQKGFTIVELLIVIVVIGILAAISIVAYNNVTQKARDDQRLTNARNVVNALSSYHAENGTWPTGAADARTILNGYDTVKVGTGVTALITTATPAVSGNDANRLQLRVCSSGGSVVGISITHRKEADGTLPVVSTGTISGTGVTCALTA